jgi:hypothetical protein
MNSDVGSVFGATRKVRRTTAVRIATPYPSHRKKVREHSMAAVNFDYGGRWQEIKKGRLMGGL